MYILENLIEPVAHFQEKQHTIFGVLWASYSTNIWTTSTKPVLQRLQLVISKW